MKPVSLIHGPLAPLLVPNIDTDVIVRVDRLMEFQKGELGRYLFEPLRYFEDGRENPSFVLNQPMCRRAKFRRYFYRQLPPKWVAPHCNGRGDDCRFSTAGWSR